MKSVGPEGCHRPSWANERSGSADICNSLAFFFFFQIFNLFLERGKRREKERERNIDVRETSISCLSHAPQLGTWSTAQACATTGNCTSDLSVCRPALNPLSHTSQGPTHLLLLLENRLRGEEKESTLKQVQDYPVTISPTHGCSSMLACLLSFLKIGFIYF